MSNTSCNFYVPSAFNADNDITWSFQYALSGNSNSSGGFCTFLFNNNYLSGGSALSGLGYTGSYGVSGINDNIIGVAFDTTGFFGTSSQFLTSGRHPSNRIPNSLTIRTGTKFTYLTCISLSTLGIPLLSSSADFNTIRFNLTDVRQTLNISLKDKTTNRYNTVLSIDTGLGAPLPNQYQYQIGFSYASPITGTNKTAFLIKDIHCHGLNTINERVLGEISDIGEENFILQSPLSGKIIISPYTNKYLLKSE